MSKSKAPAKSDLATLEMFVLDVLRHDDAEQLISIVRMLNDRTCIGWRDYWPHDFTQNEVLAAVEELDEQGHVEILREDPQGKLVATRVDDRGMHDGESAPWYRLTPKGRAAWSDWQPPA